MDIVNEKILLEECSDMLENNKDVRKLLQERLEFYTNENKKLERSLKLLHIIEDNGAMNNKETAKIVEKLVNLQEKFGIDKFNPTAMSMVYIEQMYDSEDISAQLQNCLNIQNQISTKILEESKAVKCALSNAETQINDIDVKSEELQTLKSQLNKYEAEVLKYEERCHWLKDPSLDLLAIVEKTNDLKSLQYEEDKLVQELDQYKDLQPDLAEAHQQLLKLKEEYEKVNSEMFNLL